MSDDFRPEDIPGNLSAAKAAIDVLMEVTDRMFDDIQDELLAMPEFESLVHAIRDKWTGDQFKLVNGVVLLAGKIASIAAVALAGKQAPSAMELIAEGVEFWGRQQIYAAWDEENEAADS